MKIPHHYKVIPYIHYYMDTTSHVIGSVGLLIHMCTLSKKVTRLHNIHIFSRLPVDGFRDI